MMPRFDHHGRRPALCSETGAFEYQRNFQRRRRGVLGWVVGVEPTTSRATVWRSATELYPPQCEKVLFYTTFQFIEQAPGPRGSPQLPHGLALNSVAAAFCELTPNRESCCCSFLLSHFGHFTFCDPWTIVSNSCWQLWQMYSKIGMSGVSDRID